MSWFERLSALDAMFLYIEDRTAHMHVGAMLVFGGPAPSYEAFASRIASRLPRVPRYRQRLATVALGAGRPVWIDDARFDLAYHVRRAALPPPGGEAELEELAGRIFGERLERDRPLWELWLVTGLRDGRFAVLSKTHHCIIDGIAGADLTGVFCDSGGGRDGDVPPAEAPGSWTPRPAPAASALLAASLADRLRHPLRALAGALAGPGPERRALLELAAGAKPLLALVALQRAPASPINRPIGARRRWATAALALAEVKAVRARLGCTVNDVVLAVVAGALRAALLARGEADAPELTALVPVSVRARGAGGTHGNEVTAVLCRLPVGEPDAARRLELVTREMRRLKESGQALGALLWVRLGELAPAALLAGVARFQTARPYMNLVVTNVPGPQHAIHLLGRRLLAWHPLVPLAPRQTLGVAVQSYDGQLGFGLLGDAGAAGDVAALARAVPAALAELSALAARRATG